VVDWYRELPLGAGHVDVAGPEGLAPAGLGVCVWRQTQPVSFVSRWIETDVSSPLADEAQVR